MKKTIFVVASALCVVLALCAFVILQKKTHAA